MSARGPTKKLSFSARPSSSTRVFTAGKDTAEKAAEAAAKLESAAARLAEAPIVVAPGADASAAGVDAAAKQKLGASSAEEVAKATAMRGLEVSRDAALDAIFDQLEARVQDGVQFALEHLIEAPTAMVSSLSAATGARSHHHLPRSRTIWHRIARRAAFRCPACA